MKQLEWGETPWDNLTKEELLREVQRMYCAVSSAYSVLLDYAGSDPSHPFWSKEGRGARTLEMCRQSLANLEDYEPDNMYRSFFRYAHDLLFDSNPNAVLGFGWHICPKCGTMRGSKNDVLVGESCMEPKCNGVLRKLEWGDLAYTSQNEAVTQTELDKLRNDNKRLREESWSDGDEIRYLRQLVRGELSLTDADIDGMLANNRKQAAS